MRPTRLVTGVRVLASTQDEWYNGPVGRPTHVLRVDEPFSNGVRTILVPSAVFDAVCVGTRGERMRTEGGQVDLQLGVYIGNAEWQIGKMLDIIQGLSSEEMIWTPPGVRNSLSWLAGHFGGVLWECYGLASGATIPANLSDSGIPPGWLRNLSYDGEAPLPGTTGDERVAYLKEAWASLRGYLVEQHPGWESVQVVRPPDEIKSMWWMLHHCLIDAAYHTGQASYLKMLLRERGVR